MPVNDMKKLTVLLPAADADLVLRRLMHLGCVELVRDTSSESVLEDLDTLQADEAEIAERVAHVDRILPILQKRRKKRRHVRPAVDPDAFLQSSDAERARKTVSETEKLLDTVAATKEALDREQVLMHSLLPYLDFSYPLHELGTKTTVFLLGSLPVGTEESALQALADEVGFVADVLSTDKSGIYIAAVTHRTAESAAREALSTLGFAEAHFSDTSGRAVAVFDAAQKRAEKHDSDLKRFEARLNVLAENLEDVCILADVERTALQTARLKTELLAYGSCAFLTAWCPAYEAARVEALLSEITVAFSLTDPAPTEKPPCPKEEPPYRGALASLFAIYRTPWHGNCSLAPFLTVLYLLLFGLLFADALLGAVAILLSLGTLLLKPPLWLRRAMLLLCACGIACLPFGFLCGNYLGDLLFTLLPEGGVREALIPLPAAQTALTAFRAFLLEPRSLFAVALAPAAIYLLTVLLLRTISLCRAARAPEALLTVLPHLVFFAGIGLLWLHPIIGAATAGTALIAMAITGCLIGKTAAARLIAIGGRLLDLLLDLAHALTAARTLVLAAVAAPCLFAIGLLPLPALFLPIGMLVAFAVTHALHLLINTLPPLAKRAKLCYMARFAAHYPHRDVLHRPLQLVNRYIIDISVLQTENDRKTDDEPDLEAAYQELNTANAALHTPTDEAADGSDGTVS